jgi:hypothetical protein
MASARTVIAVIFMAATVALASGCRVVGSGTLGYVPASEGVEPSSVLGSPAEVRVFRHEAGHAWPPPGKLGIVVTADDIPYDGPSPLLLIGMTDPSLYGAPRVHRCDELSTTGGVFMWGVPSIYEEVHVNPDHSVRALFAVADAPDWPGPTGDWVLAAVGRVPDAEVYAVAVRCGHLAWEAP